MKRVLCLVLCVLAATFVIKKVSAGGANSPIRFGFPRRPNNLRRAQPSTPPSGTRILRVTTSDNPAAALVPQSSIQSINLDSTRFYIELDGVPTLYAFDFATFDVKNEGPLFAAAASELADPSWSAVNPDLLYGFDSSEQPRLCSYDLNTGALSVIKDFSGEVGPGEVGNLSKARRDDDHFSFAWKATSDSDWRYVFVWDRKLDSLLKLALDDSAASLKRYRQSYFDATATNLIIAGDSVIKWDYAGRTSGIRSVRLRSDSVEGTAVYASDPYLSFAARWEPLIDFVRGRRLGSTPMLFDNLGSPLSSAPDVYSGAAGFAPVAVRAFGGFINNDQRSDPRLTISPDGRLFIFNAAAGTGRQDVFLAIKSESPQAMQSINWTGLVNCIQSGSTLVKNAGSNGQDDARAFSEEVVNDAGSIEFTAEETGKERWCGLTGSPTSYAGVQDLAFGVRLARNGKAFVSEQGATKAKVKYRPGDVFTISIEAGNAVDYFKNGSLFYTSQTQATLPLQIAASLFDEGATIGNGGVTPTPPASSGGQVAWTSVVNCTPSGASLQKTSGRDDTPDAGGISQQSINSGDGYVEFTTAETNKERWCGLGNGNLQTNPTGIAYCWKLTVTGVAAVRESGVYRTETTYKTGDRLRVAVSGGAVKYYKNSSLVYTSAIKPSYPLGISASFINVGGTITNATVSTPTPPPPPIAVSISPATAALQTGQAQQFQATVTGTTNTTVTWSATGGTVTSAGVYTAPQAAGSYIVKATSVADASKSASATVTVSAVVSQPPVITSVSVSGITTNSAAITWQTSQPADSDVEYGTTAAYGNSTPINSGLVTSHSVALAGLSGGTTYHYRVKSRNSSGILAVSPDSTFATAQPAGGGGGGGSTSVPLSYNAVTDRTPRPVPALPALGGAGSTVTDPTFGTSILRVTDPNTRPDRANRAFHTPSSAEANTWNTDSTIFYITGEGGEAIAYNFDPIAMRATRMGDTSGPSGGSILPFGGEPTFSFTSKYVLYGMDGATGTLLQQYDFQSAALTNLLDVKTVVSSFTGGYVGGVSNSGDDKFNIYFGGQAQNDATFVLVWDKNTRQSTLLDTQAGTVNGSAAGSISWGWTVHNSRIDKSGRYVVISTASGPYSLVVWDLQSRTFVPITNKGGGHKVSGFGYIVNNDGFTDGDQWLIRSLSNLGSFSTLINPELSPTEWVTDSHLSWNNAQPGVLVPVFLSTYHSQPSSAPWRAWDDEIVAVRTDGIQTTVWRFAHHFSTYVGFWSSPRGNISQDGRFFMFTSNWGNTLGTDREDAFVLKLPLSN